MFLLRFCLGLGIALAPASCAEEDEDTTSFSDYLPLKHLILSRSALKTGGASKSMFYDFLPSELEGKKARQLEIRSLFSVSYLP